ncbi:MAG TPA: hypothetical protein PKM21_00010 [Anaerolineales bacterium]|nr:hypothetical protein [Anaerolineales bacterium]
MKNRLLIIILILAALLRLGVALALGDQVEILPGTFDQISYHTLATRLLDGHGFTMPAQWWPITPAGEPTAHWSYLYTFYLVGVYAIFGTHALAARLLQALLAGLLMPWLAYRLAQRLFPGKSLRLWRLELSPALLAAAWVAFYPYFLYYAGSLMTETFYITAILWSLDRALSIIYTDDGDALHRRHPYKNYFLLGLALALTVLLRQVFLPFVPCIFLWLWWACARQAGWKPALKPVLLGGLLCALLLALCIAPFTLLNYQHFGRFVLLNTNAGYAFFWANHPVHGYSFVSLFTPDMPSYQELIPQELRHLNEAALDQALLKLGLGFVLEDPLRFLSLCVTRIPAHFIFWPLPGSSLPSNLTRLASIGLALPFMLAGALLWVLDARRARLDPRPGALLALFCFVYVGIHLLSWAGIRYRLPTDAVALVFAAYALWRFLAWATFLRRK